MEYLNGWTKEKVIEHVKKEFKGKSVGGDGLCKYRDNDRKCIAGCFIPDEKYDEKLEDKDIQMLMEDSEIDYMPLCRFNMQNWQELHDSLNENLTIEEQTDDLLKFLEQ